MASSTFRCRLVTPVAALVDDQVKYASVPAWDGLFGVQPGRAALLARLGTGELRLDYPDGAGKGAGQGGSRVFVLDGGFVKMAGEELTILAESAVAAETITIAEAEAELRAAEARPSSGAATDSPEARALVVESRQRAIALAKLKVKVAKEKGGI